MRILLVEDEPDLLRVISRSLREAGYAVDMAHDGEEGLFKAMSWDYDAIILDIMLPKKSGWDVMSELRQMKSTPALMLTARDSVTDRVRGLDSGADDYLVKPFELAELLARLRALIRRSAGKSNSIITLGDIVVDTVAQTVSKGGAQVDLTAREYALVELFSLHSGKLVSRTMIYEHIFDEREDTMSNLIDVHVSNIRKKLGKGFIATRRGQGYQVIDS